MEENINVIINGFQYNSVVILSYFFICVAIWLIDLLTKGKFANKFFRTKRSSLLNPLTYFRLFSHSLGHCDWDHLSCNFIKILLIGPSLEEKYGSFNILMMIIITSGIIGIVNSIFSNSWVRGASGVLYMMIVLSSFVNVQAGKIPFTLVLILLFFVLDDIIKLFTKKDDDISYLGHVTGAICGLAFGIMFYKGFNFESLL